VKLTEKQIGEIVCNLDYWMRCLYNIKTGELKTASDFNNWIGADEEAWVEELIRNLSFNLWIKLNQTI
jgi:hypothetical protein